MKLPQINRKSAWYPLALAFGIPAGMLLVLMFVTSAAPFGSYSMLYSDMFHQYYPFFRAFRAHLRSGESLLWDWSAGMGMDYLGLISYYLASPLNLLSVLVPDSWVMGYFALLMPVKLGLASLSFAWMLRKLFGRNDLSISLFGAMYGMCAWALGYQWNIMWLDTFALLPLVALGTVCLLRDKKYILYTVSLFLSVFANYYIGFFVCIFVFLLFFCYEICRFRSVGRFLLDLMRIAFFSLLAIGMTAVLELPALAALQNTQSSVNNFPEGFQINLISGDAVNAAKEAWSAYRAARESGEGGMPWGLLLTALKTSFGPVTQAMILVSGQMGGGKSPTYMDGSPNLYCGVLPVFLGFVFLLAKDVKLRDKLCCVFLLVFFMLSIIIRQLDYIWHGFHFTNQIPYRFSFLFSFVLLYMAYRAWLLRDRIRLWQLVTAAVLSGGLFLLYQENRQDLAYLSFNFSFLGLYGIVLLFGHRDLLPEPEAPVLPVTPSMEELSLETLLPETEEPVEMPAEEPVEEEPVPHRASWLNRLPDREGRRKISALACAAVVTLELVLNVVAFGATFGIYNYDYPKNGDATASMLKVMREHENGRNLFYRVEMTHAQTLNDGPLNGYNGISTFTSSANVKVTEFMKGLGYAAWNTYNRYCYEDGSPVSNLFLNVKYMLEREFEVGENAYFDVLHSYKNVTLLENNAYLPLGFLTRPELAETSFTTGSNFQIQNRVFAAATGLQGDVWEPVPNADVTVVPENVTVKIENMAGYTSYTGGSTGGKLMYEYNMTQTGFLCIDVNLYSGKNFTVWHNGKRLYSESYGLPQMFAVCSVQPGDKVQVVVECKAEEDSSVSIKGAVLNDEKFRQGYAILKTSTLELTEFSSTRLSGVIRCDRDGLLYTSIPQDGNWKAFVDGQPVETTLVGEAMLALELTQGSHTVEFRYENRAFTMGLLVSLGCGLVFGGIILTQWLLRRRKNAAAA